MNASETSGIYPVLVWLIASGIHPVVVWSIALEDFVAFSPNLILVTGHFMLVWKKGIAVLAAGPTKVTPDNRIRLVDGYNLEISNVQTQDAGDYACQIATLQPTEIIHTVEILGEYCHVVASFVSIQFNG